MRITRLASTILGSTLALIIAFPSYAHAESADVIPANERGGPPPGYHKEERIRLGLVIAGSIATLTGGIFVLQGMQIQRENEERLRKDPEDLSDQTSTAPYVTGAIMLLVGVPMLTIGLFDKKEVYVRDSAARLEFVPVATTKTQGAYVNVRF